MGIGESYRTCACATGRLASAVWMSYTSDLTYAYSRHLLCGIAETTSAIIVFCVPAIPIAFRGGVGSWQWGTRTSNRKSLFTSTTYLPPESSQQQRQRRGAQTSYGNSTIATTIRAYHSMGEQNRVDLTEPRPARTHKRRISRNECDESPLNTDVQMRILRTTEIEITTGDESESSNPSTPNGQVHTNGWKTP